MTHESTQFEELNRRNQEASEQIAGLIRWQLAVDTAGTHPERQGLTPDDIAYSMRLQEMSAGNGTTEGRMLGDASRRAQLREKAKLNMRVETGVATSDEVGYYSALKDNEPVVLPMESKDTPEPVLKTETKLDKPSEPPVEPERTVTVPQARKQVAKATTEAKVKQSDAPVPAKQPQATPRPQPVKPQPKPPRPLSVVIDSKRPSRLSNWKQRRADKKAAKLDTVVSANDIELEGTQFGEILAPTPVRPVRPSVRKRPEQAPASRELLVSAYPISAPASYRSNPKHEKHGTPNEDSYIFNQDIDLYAVLDGVGGESNGAQASAIAAKYIEETFVEKGLDRRVYTGEYNLRDRNDIEKVIDVMRLAMSRSRFALRGELGNEGATTAAVVKVLRQEDKVYALLGNVGDSRILRRPKNGVDPNALRPDKHADTLYELVAEQADENEPHVIINALNGSRLVSNMDEFRFVELNEGDQLLICSDGITGDTVEQRLTYAEIEDGFSQTSDKKVAERFLQLSRSHMYNRVLHCKVDDKTAISLSIK